MKKPSVQYFDALTKAFEKINEQYDHSIEEGAKLMAASIERDELIHVFGTGGHSTMGAMELFWRAGSIAPINPLLDASLLPSNGALHSNWMERTEGLAQSIMRSYEMKEGETIIIVNAYGINPVTIDAALEARRIGMKSIGVTSTSFALSVPKNLPMRHSSGQNLHELVDVFVDCQLPLGDAVIEIPGSSQKIGPTATILNSYCLHLLVAATVEILVSKGLEIPVWMSANLEGGDDNNKRWHAKYNERVRHLR